MVRKLLIVLALVVAAGGVYFVFFAKEKTEQGDLAGYVPPPMDSVSDQKRASSTTKGKEFWTQRCNTDGDMHCEVFQRLMIKETKQRLIEFAVGYPKETKGKAQAVILLPLGVMVSEGITLTVDKNPPARAVYRTCAQTGCIVAVDLPDDYLNTMKTGKMITISFVDSSTAKQMNIEMSLEGFGAKIEKIKSFFYIVYKRAYIN